MENLETRILVLEKEIEKIKIRNQNVEKNKLRETSLSRKIGIICLTYSLMSLFMFYIGVENFWINAIVPTLGFFLSTLSLDYLRKIWEKNKK